MNFDEFFDSIKPITVMAPNTVRVVDARCPTCKQMIEGASASGLTQRTMPNPGDLGVCAFCGEFIAYCLEGGKLVIVVGTEEDFKKLPVDMQQRVREMIKMFKLMAEHRAKKGSKMILKMTPKTYE